MAMPADNTIALCPHCKAPLKPHPFDPSYSHEDKCVLCEKPRDHSIHRV